LTARADEPLGSGITMAPTTFLVGFDGQGVPYTDVAVSSVLASNATLTLTLTLSGSSRTVTVYPETGRVLVQ
jgi:precorrin-4 methylase